MTDKPKKSGYADVNGFRLYHEVYGAGDRMSSVQLQGPRRTASSVDHA